MIFSRKQLDTAQSYLSYFYDKIIFVDSSLDTFELVKMNQFEYQSLAANLDKFTDWIRIFESPKFSKNFSAQELEKKILSSKPFSYRYEKLIGNDYHEMILEYLPIDQFKGYLFVFDNSSFEMGRETCDE